MQRRQSVLLPGESAPNAFSRNVAGSVAGRGNVGHRQIPAMTITGAPRQPLNAAVAPHPAYATREQGYRPTHMHESMTNKAAPAAGVAAASHQSRAQQVIAAQERGVRASETELAQEFRTGTTSVNMDDYFKGVLSQFKEDSAVMNPMNITITPDEYSGAKTGDEAEAVITRLAAQAAVKSSLVDFVGPIGHSAIDDTRIFCDTLVRPQSYAGYPSGEIPMQFVEFNGISPPDRIVKITLSPFNFPHVYLPTTTVFDLFYFRSVFMSIRFVPTTHLIQSSSPNELFTFELYVNHIDSSAVYLTPIEPTFILKQPVSVTGDLTVKFQVRSPSGGFIDCPIPALRVTVRRYLAPFGGPTTFLIVDGSYIGVLAPYGALYSVPIVFQTIPPAPPADSVFLAGTSGQPASNFRDIVVPGVGTFPAFDIPADTSGIPPPPPGAEDRSYIFIPKNGVSFNIRFSSLQPNKTNDLIPIHT